MTEQQDARHLLERAERAATAGDYLAADELLRDAARIQEEELGPHHPDLANTLSNLAIVAERTGSSREAEAFYRRAAAITAAALPSDHPMTVASRQNLEDFCRESALSIDAPAVTTPTRDSEWDASPFISEYADANHVPVEPDKTGIRATGAPTPAAAAPRPAPLRPEASALDPIPGKASHLLGWVVTGAVVLGVAVLLVVRPWSPRDASTVAPPPAPAAAQPATPAPPQVAGPPTRSVAIEPSAPPASAPPREDRKRPREEGGRDRRHRRRHRASMPHLLDEWQQLALRSGG